MKRIVFIFVFFVSSPFLSGTVSEAYLNYQKGVRSENLFEKEQLFNRALQIYLEQEEREFFAKNSNLFYNIGNSYYVLGEYPLAVYYYYKVLNQNPDFSPAYENLLKAQNQLGIAQGADELPFWQRMNVYLYLIWIFTFILFGRASLLIWSQNENVKTNFSITIPLFLILLVVSAFMIYILPAEGVMIRTTPLYSGPGSNSPPIPDTAAFAGSKVKVLESLDSGEWLKIISPDGKLGFVSVKNIRLI